MLSHAVYSAAAAAGVAAAAAVQSCRPSRIRHAGQVPFNYFEHCE